MFVSSYNTYISTNTTNKADKKADLTKNSTTVFELKQDKDDILKSTNIKNLPVNYISNYKAFSNKQKLDQQILSYDEVKYNQIKSMKDAQSAYTSNSKMFSFMQKPKSTLVTIQPINQELPSKIQKLQEEKIRHTMVNTYLANDRYYQITA